jgi:hypothetical protein
MQFVTLGSSFSIRARSAFEFGSKNSVYGPFFFRKLAEHS